MERLFPFFPERRLLDPALLAAGLCPSLPLLDGRLVWGAALLEALAGAGLETVDVAAGGSQPQFRELPAGAGLPEALHICLLLEDRREGYSYRELSLVGRGLCGMGLDAAALAQSSAARLLFSAGRLQLLPRWEKLGPALREAVDAGRLELKAAETVASLPEASIIRLDELGRAFSFSDRRRLFIQVCELAHRDSLDTPGLDALIDRLSAARDPLSELARLRNPERSRLEREFTSFRNEILKGSGISLSPPPEFEGGSFRLEFEFTGRDQLGRRIKALEKLHERSVELDRFL